MTRFPFLVSLIAATALPAGAATLDIDGGVPGVLPGNYSVPSGGTQGDTVTVFSATEDGGALGGGLTLDGPAELTFTYLGSEASYDNIAFAPVLDGGSSFGNETSDMGDMIGAFDEGGYVDFGFATHGGSGALSGTIANGATATDSDLYLAFGDIAEDGRSVTAYFGDGYGDNDFDDMVVGVTASPVPVPAALPLLVGALGGLGVAGRRWTRRT